MSVKAMNWVWSLDELAPSETLVLLALADAADDDGFCWPSQALLARKARQTDRNVRRILTRLSQAGLLAVETRSSTHGRRSNRYWLNIGSSLESRQPDNLSGCGEAVGSSPVDNFEGAAVSVEIPATGQSVRLRKRTDCPVAQPDTGVRSQPDTDVRLHIGRTTSKNHQTGPDRRNAQSAPEVDASDLVRSGSASEAEPTAQAAPAPPSRPARTAAVKLNASERAVLGSFLPESMLALDPSGAVTVVRMLRERYEAGWTPSQVRRLMDQPLPESVGRMSSLVASRLERNVPVDGAPATIAAVSEDERHAERQRRADALAGTRRPEPHTAADEAVWAQVRADMPGASHLELALEVNNRLASRPVEGDGPHE